MSLVGEMNGWRPGATPMARGADGAWTVTVPLAPGQWVDNGLIADFCDNLLRRVSAQLTVGP